MQDQAHINTITNTTISMNDLSLINKWRDRTTEPDTTHADQVLAEYYTRDANQYPKLLIQALATEGTAYNAHPQSWILKAHLTPKKGTKTKPKDKYIESILLPFTTMGYSIDTKHLHTTNEDGSTANTLTSNEALAELNASTHGNWLYRCLTKNTYHKLQETLIAYDIWHTGQFTHQCGVTLKNWPETRTYLLNQRKLDRTQPAQTQDTVNTLPNQNTAIRTRQNTSLCTHPDGNCKRFKQGQSNFCLMHMNPNNTPTPNNPGLNPPEWFTSLENETLKHGAPNRVLKEEYWDTPTHDTNDTPVCFQSTKTKRLCIAIPTNEYTHTSDERTYLTFDERPPVQNNHQSTIEYEHTGRINLAGNPPHYNTHIGAILSIRPHTHYRPREERVSTPASMDTHMLEALLTQCAHQTRTYATQQHAQTTSTGSMDSQSLRMGETRERTDTALAEANPNELYKTYSDGSVYLLPRGQTCAGYATTNLTTHTCTTLIPITKDERVEVHIDTTGTTSLRIIPVEHVEVYITPKQVTREYLPAHQPSVDLNRHPTPIQPKRDVLLQT